MNFQRKGARSNTHVGKDFEEKIQSYFQNQGVELTPNVSVSIGINKKRKQHKFDLGNISKGIIVECKSHTWTESGNVPSAKMTTWDQAMYYFHACPPGYMKIFIALKDYSFKRKETLCDYYLRTKDHLIPEDVEIWEFDQSKLVADKKNQIANKAFHLTAKTSAALTR